MDPSNLLSLPTDSLYKFMAISGFIILLISIIIPFYIKKKFLFKLFELERDHNINERNINKLYKKNTTLKTDLETKFKDLKEYSKSRPEEKIEAWVEGLNSKLPSEEEQKLWSVGVNEVEKEINEIFCITERIDCEIKKIEYLSNSITVINIYSVLGLITGLVLTSTGFYLWYIKLQAFIDNAVMSGTIP